MFACRTVENPVLETETVYSPIGTLNNVKFPPELLVVSMPRGDTGLVAATFASGTDAPVSSVAVPKIRPEFSCASTSDRQNKASTKLLTKVRALPSPNLFHLEPLNLNKMPDSRYAGVPDSYATVTGNEGGRKHLTPPTRGNRDFTGSPHPLKELASFRSIIQRRHIHPCASG